jgi:hypothetical protein
MPEEIVSTSIRVLNILREFSFVCALEHICLEVFALRIQNYELYC